MKHLAIAIIVCVVCSGAALALSASPAKYVVQHHAGEDTYEITLINDEQRALTATLTPTGPMAELITVQEQVVLAPGEQQRVPVTIRMPQATQPGILESAILIEGKPVSGGTVAATSAVLHVIRVETPREGTYLAGELLSSSGIVGSDIFLTLSLTNTGTEYVSDARSTITLQGPTSHDIQPMTIALAPGETKNTVVSWRPTVTGAYEAQARVQYSDRELLLTSTVVVGELSVDITSVNVSDFRLGELFRVSANVRNNWGEPLPVTAGVTITQQGSTVASAQSTRVQVPAAASVPVPLFVDSNRMTVGDALMVVTVYYADRTAQYVTPLVVGVDTLGYEEQEPQRIFWPIYVVLLAAIVFISIIFIKRRRSL